MAPPTRKLAGPCLFTYFHCHFQSNLIVLPSCQKTVIQKPGLTPQQVVEQYQHALGFVLILSHKKHPDPKSGRDVDPDRPGCVTSCLVGLTNPSFSHAFISTNPESPNGLEGQFRLSPVEQHYYMSSHIGLTWVLISNPL